MTDGVDEGSAAMLGSAVLWDDPCLSAKKSLAKSHCSVRRVGSLGNSIDGSGSWVAFHLLDEDGNFVQGGWVPQNTQDQRRLRRPLHPLVRWRRIGGE